MYKFFLLLSSLTFIFCASAQQFELLKNNESEININHILTEIPFKYTEVSAQNYVDFHRSHKITTLFANAPELPVFNSSVMLPITGKSVATAEFDSYYEIQNVSVTPSKGNLKRNVDPSTLPYVFGESYNVDAFFPGNLIQASDPFILRDVRGQTISFYPYQYNPVTKVLRVYQNLRAKISVNKSENGINEIAAPLTKGNKTQGIYNHFFLNGQIAKYTPKEETGDMLVICPDAYVETIMPLVRWKNQKGIKTTLVTTEETGTSAENILAYIQNAYAQNGDLLYLLLVGDDAQIPAYSYGNSGGEELLSDTYYGQLSGSDYFPELFVGRFSGTTISVKTMVDRTLEYEKNPLAGNWMTKAIGLGSGEGDGFGDDGEADWQHLRNIRTKLLDYGYTQVHEFYDGSRGGDDAPGNPNASIILPAVNDGTGLFFYTGHGDLNVCVTGNFSSTNINAAVNNGKYPMVLSVACNNGTYTYGTCISEVWLRATKNGSPTGAIAACGSSILMAWTQPMQTQDEMAELITESYPNNKKSTLGGLFYNAQMSMLEQFPGIDGNEVMQTWVFFGDPSITFRNKETLDLNVTHAPQVPQVTSSLTVNCDVDNAIIAVSQNNILLGKGNAVGGNVVITFPELTTDIPLVVTATKQNYRPYQGNVQVANGGLGLEKEFLSDLSIYPNPAENELFVEFSTQEIAKVQLFDITGKCVRQTEVLSGNNKVNFQLAGISAGLYQLKIQSDSQTSISKVMIK